MSLPENKPIQTRLSALRRVMQAQSIAAVLVPSSDPHLSEYLPDRWQGRQWLSGFTGSMATLVVTTDTARLFTDSRYWTQAEQELSGTEIALEKATTGNQYIDWLAQHLQSDQTLAVDGAVLGLATHRLLCSALEPRKIRLNTTLDLLNAIWQGRPGLPSPAITEHQPPHATITRRVKLAATRTAIDAAGASHHLISSVDDISYLLNLRGSDVEYNPVFIAHLLLGPARSTLFVGAGKIAPALTSLLAKDGIDLAAYDQAAAALAALPSTVRLLLDPRRVTLGLRQAIAATVTVIEQINPTVLAKSRKSDAEAAFVREVMEQDGAALCHFYAWFENALGKERITELTIDEKLTEERAKRPGYVCPSFATIAGFNAGGALPHYRATPAAHAVIEGNGLLLIDSGGQYLGGTTDITRVWPIGTISPAQQRDFTLVLKGMMALSRAQFPSGTKAPYLDALARAPIWAAGINYGHGTGHGVGYFLNVHEGPQTISQAMPEPHTAMLPGMITSIEPGIYRPQQWGIRIENLVLNIPAQTTEFGDYLQFETLTLCPIDTRCIARELMRPDELDWLNHYHTQVRQRLSPHLSGGALAWLEKRTAKIS